MLTSNSRRPGCCFCWRLLHGKTPRRRRPGHSPPWPDPGPAAAPSQPQTGRKSGCVAARRYSPAGGEDSLHLSLQCAGDSYKFDVASDVVNRDGAISGSWNEALHNASGSVSGRASGNTIEATARGGNFTTGLSLTTSGNRQSVTLTPQGTDVRSVSVALAKR